jgi:hypothetical protein
MLFEMLLILIGAFTRRDVHTKFYGEKSPENPPDDVRSLKNHIAVC